MNEKKQSYVKPQIHLLEVDVKTSILTGSGDPTITNPDMEWDSREYNGADNGRNIDIWKQGW